MGKSTAIKKRTIFSVCALILAVIITATLAWFAITAEANAPVVNAKLPCFAEYFDGGAGTEASPYEIRTPEQLKNLAWLQYMGYFNRKYSGKDKADTFYFKLTNSIDMTGWTLPPIGTEKFPFIGYFEGNGKTIEGLTVSNSSDPKTYTAIVNSSTAAIAPKSVTTVTDVNCVGVFGVVGKISDSNVAYDPNKCKLNRVKIYKATINVTTEKALAGVAVGYLNGNANKVLVRDEEISTINTTSATSAYDTSLTSNLSDYFTVGYATKDYTTSGTDTEVVIDKPELKDTTPDDGSGASAGTAWGNSVSMNAMYSRIDSMYTSAGYFQYPTTKTITYDANGNIQKTELGTTYKRPESSEATYNLKHYKDTDGSAVSGALLKHDASVWETMLNWIGVTIDDCYYLYGKNTIASEYAKVIHQYKGASGYFYILNGEQTYYLSVVNSAIGKTAFKSKNDASKWAFATEQNEGKIVTRKNSTPYYLTASTSSLNVSVTTDAVNAITWYLDTTANQLYTLGGDGTKYYLKYENGNWKLAKGNEKIIYITDGQGNYMTSTCADKWGTDKIAETVSQNFTSTTNKSAAAKITIKEYNNTGKYTLQFDDGKYICFAPMSAGNLTITAKLLYKDSSAPDDADDSNYFWEYKDNCHFVNQGCTLHCTGSKWEMVFGDQKTFLRIYTDSYGSRLYMRGSGSSTNATEATNGSVHDFRTYWRKDGNQWQCGDGRYLYYATTGGKIMKTGGKSASIIYYRDNRMSTDGLVWPWTEFDQNYLYYDTSNAGWYYTEAAVDKSWSKDATAARNKAAVIGMEEVTLISTFEYVSTPGSIVDRESTGILEEKESKEYETPETYIPMSTADDGIKPNAKDNIGYLVGGAYADQIDDKVKNLGDVVATANCYTFKNLRYSNDGASTYSGGNLEILTIGKKTGNNFVRIRDSYNTDFTSSRLSDYSEMTVSELGLNRYDVARANLESSLGSNNIDGLYFRNCKPGLDSSGAGVATLNTAKVNGSTYPDYEMARDSFDIHVKENGYINMFTASFIKGTQQFFSLYRIYRDGANNKISLIREIDEIYTIETEETENGKTSISTEYIYKYVDDNSYYKVKFGDEDKSVSKPAASNLAFSRDWLEGSGSIEKSPDIISGIVKYGALYYFEIPVSKGEYAIGGTYSSGTSSLITYLDIGSNPLNTKTRKETIKSTEMDFKSPSGVFVGPNSQADTMTDTRVSLSVGQSTAASTISLKYIDSKETVSATNNVVTISDVGEGITVSGAKARKSTETITKTLTSITENASTKTYEKIEVKVVQKDGVEESKATKTVSTGTFEKNDSGLTVYTEKTSTSTEVDNTEGKLSISNNYILKYSYRGKDKIECKNEFNNDTNDLKYIITLKPETDISRLKISKVDNLYKQSTINGTVMKVN